MRGERLAAAKEAAVSYVNGVPDDVEVGLVSFNDTVTVDVRPTRDKEAVISAINALTAGRRTALWDGITTGLDLANPQPGRTPTGRRATAATRSNAATLEDVSLSSGCRRNSRSTWSP